MLRVLLVEDNPADVFLIQEGINASSIPAHIQVAYDAEQASRMMSESRFDLVILDLNLPKATGHDLLERYSAAATPVVVFSGSENPEDRVKALAGGASDYVVKPRTFDAFIGVVQEILTRWSKGSGQPRPGTPNPAL
jgi:DNA-binding response OmpR family regulator